MPNGKAIYPGSFDPPTLGHLDVIKRASKVFDHLTVLVAQSSRKSSTFTGEERKRLIEKCVEELPNVSVDIHQGLTVDYVKKADAKVIIRGLRAVSDFEYELQMATMNRKLVPDIETFIVMAAENYHYISSNTVKEVAMHKGDISKLVPAPVVEALENKFN